MPYAQGDIVIVPFPFTNLQGAKNRPAIIISGSLINNFTADAILLQITSQQVSPEYLFRIENSDVTIPFRPPATGQNIVCHKIAVIEQRLITRKISALNPDKLALLLQKVHSLIS